MPVQQFASTLQGGQNSCEVFGVWTALQTSNEFQVL